MTFYINPNAQVANPIFPPLQELDPTLALLFNANQISGFADGAPVASFTTQGAGSERLRLFNRMETNWQPPTFDASRPSLRFGGGQGITNFEGASIFPIIPVPATVFVRFKSDRFDYSSSTIARIMGGGLTGETSWAIRPTNVASQYFIGAGTTSVLINTGLATGAWGVIGVSFNGANTLIVGPDGTVTSANLQSIPLNGVRLGGNSNPTVVAQAFLGNIDRARIYTRAMSEADLVTMRAQLAA